MRIPPLMPASAYKTFEVSQPLQTHFRPATCQEVDCDAYARGWQTTVDTATPLGVKQANYIRLVSGRHFTFTETGTLVAFVFAPGQKCFAQHRVSLEREQFFIARGGDHRGNPRQEGRVHANPADWVDDFSTQLDVIKTAIEAG
jgi:hypothetical protein